MRNIARQIRETFTARYDRRQQLEAAALKVPEIFDGVEATEIATRKGLWKIYAQKGYRPRSFVEEETTDPTDRFAAIYFRESRVRTIVRGHTADSEEIRSILQTCTRKTLEQRPLFSIPARSLTEENGLSYGVRVGFLIAGLLVLFVLFDFVVIPDYPELILQAANITTGSDVNSYSLDSPIFAYQSITGRLLDSLFPAKYRHLATSMYTLVAAFVVPILVCGIVYEVAGKRADRRRVRALPNLGEGLSFGFDVVSEVLLEYREQHAEKQKIELYTVLTAQGLKMNRSEFEIVFTRLLRPEETAETAG